MFASVEVTVSKPHYFLTLPQTAITFNPYGDIVYVITEKGKDDKGNPIYIANQRFVTTGETRGDQIQVRKGLEEGDVVVTSGQLKLQNGSRVTINNQIQPSDDPDPKIVDQ
jgi:membrane fusion protein (multidrug efflux system)